MLVGSLRELEGGVANTVAAQEDVSEKWVESQKIITQLKVGLGVWLVGGARMPGGLDEEEWCM